MKYLIVLAPIFLLTGCIIDEPRCHKEVEPDQKIRAERFYKCLELAEKAKSGKSYTTHNSEDYDVIKACDTAAYYQSLGQEKKVYK